RARAFRRKSSPKWLPARSKPWAAACCSRWRLERRASASIWPLPLSAKARGASSCSCPCLLGGQAQGGIGRQQREPGGEHNGSLCWSHGRRARSRLTHLIPPSQRTIPVSDAGTEPVYSATTKNRHGKNQFRRQAR